MMEFKSFKNIEMMGPLKNKQRFDMTVEPNSYEIVLMKAGKGARYEYGAQDRCVYLGDDALKAYAIKKNFFVERDGKDIGLYKTWHDAGFITLYVNKTSNKVFKENVTYTLQGMTVEDTGQTEATVQVDVGPGCTQLVKLLNIRGAEARKLSASTTRRKIAVIN